MDYKLAAIDEIFYSFQGEGIQYLGRPMIFVRFFGCSIGCSFCDVPQVSQSKNWLSPQEVYKKMMSELSLVRMSNDTIALEITGGEPLEQREALGDLIYYLDSKALSLHKDIIIETSGLKDLTVFNLKNKSVRYVLDFKIMKAYNFKDDKINTDILPDFWKNNIHLVTELLDCVKIVVGSKKHIEAIGNILESNRVPLLNYMYNNFKLIFSPIFSKDNKCTMTNEMLHFISHSLPKAMVRIQEHKILNVR